MNIAVKLAFYVQRLVISVSTIYESNKRGQLTSILVENGGFKKYFFECVLECLPWFENVNKLSSFSAKILMCYLPYLTLDMSTFFGNFIDLEKRTTGCCLMLRGHSLIT